MGQPDARIYLRPIGSPLTIGMSGLAIASLVQSGFDLRWVAVSQETQVGLILLAVPFVLQLLASVFSYLARDGATGAAVAVLATTWGALGLVHIVSVAGARSAAAGLLLLAAGGVLSVSSLAIAMSKPLPALVFLLAAARFVLTGLYQLGASTWWRDAGGVVGLVVVALAAYCVLAFELEGQQGESLLPTFRRGHGAAAVRDALAAQIDAVAHEPGVRQTT
jgi:uncharacterized protein